MYISRSLIKSVQDWVGKYIKGTVNYYGLFWTVFQKSSLLTTYVLSTEEGGEGNEVVLF